MALCWNHRWNAFYAVAACGMMTTCGNFSSAGDAREHFENQLHWETVAPSWWQPKGLANLEAVEMNVCHRWNWHWPLWQFWYTRAGSVTATGKRTAGQCSAGLLHQSLKVPAISAANCSKIHRFKQFKDTTHKSSDVISDLQYLRRCDHTLVFLVTSALEVLAKGCLGHDWQHLPSQEWLLQRRPWLRSLTLPEALCGTS